MSRLLPLVPLAALAACGTPRDTSFHRIVQFTAVDKIQLSNDGFVYFRESMQLERVPMAGGTVEPVASGFATTDFAVAPGHVYAATGSGVMHLAVTAAGKLAEPVPLSGDVARGIAADANGVTWMTCDRLTHAQLDGSGQVSTPLAAQCLQVSALALDSSTAYGVNAGGDWYAARSGGAASTFATRACVRIAAAGGWLYCANSLGLSRIDPFHGDSQDLLEGDVHDFAIGASRIYAALGADLVSLPRNGGGYEVLGTLADISAVALDGADVYFVNTDEGLGLLLRTAQ